MYVLSLNLWFLWQSAAQKRLNAISSAKKEPTWNTWLLSTDERGLQWGSLEGRHKRRRDYSGRWLLIRRVICSLCDWRRFTWSRSTILMENVLMSLLSNSIFPQEIYDFSEDVSTCLKNIKKKGFLQCGYFLSFVLFSDTLKYLTKYKKCLRKLSVKEFFIFHFL